MATIPTSASSKSSFSLLIKRSCLFFLSFLLFIILFLGFISFIIFVILKPKKPIFTVQKTDLESYKLDVVLLDRQSTVNHNDDQVLFLSSLVSFTLNASNPNKFGISYSSTRFQVLEGKNGTVIGMVKIPGFHQPPRSNNVSFPAQVILQCLNVNEIISSSSKTTTHQEEDASQIMRVLGDIRVQIRIFHINLPKLLIAVECGVTMDKKQLTFNSKMTRLKEARNKDTTWSNKYASLPAVSKLFSKKCSFAVYI